MDTRTFKTTVIMALCMQKSDVKQSIQRMPKVCHDGLELFLVPFAVTRLQVVFEDFW